MADAEAGPETALIPLEVDGQSVYLSVRELGAPGQGQDEEHDIAFRRPTLEQALSGLTGMAKELGARLRETEASRATVEFGCEFALELGTLVTIIGRASSRSSVKVVLEWTSPEP